MKRLTSAAASTATSRAANAAAARLVAARSLPPTSNPAPVIVKPTRADPVVIVPDDVRITIAPPLRDRFAPDAGHRGEFSAEWARLRTPNRRRA